MEIIRKKPNYILVRLKNQQTEIFICSVCINQATEISTVLEELNDELIAIKQDHKDPNLIIGGDFNGRIGARGAIDELQLPTSSNFSRLRESLDVVVNERGQRLIEFAERNEIFFTNGRCGKDTPAQFTFIGTQGQSVIDLVLCNARSLYFVSEFEVLNFITKSDHLPVMLSIVFQTDNNEKKINKLRWQDDKGSDYSEKMKHLKNISLVDANANEMYENLILCIKGTAKELKMISSGIKSFKQKKEKWFDDDCQNYMIILDNAFKETTALGFPAEKNGGIT